MFNKKEDREFYQKTIMNKFFKITEILEHKNTVSENTNSKDRFRADEKPQKRRLGNWNIAEMIHIKEKKKNGKHMSITAMLGMLKG